jgi:hypothetical protein
MDILLVRIALIIIVAVVVGGSTYVVLTIVELLQKK